MNPDKAWMHRAAAAFRELTGKKAVDDIAAWRVFFEALRASAFPTKARREWLTKTATPFLEMSDAAKRAEVLRRVRQAQAGAAPGMTVDESEQPLTDRIRASLRWLDPRFADKRKLTDNVIAEALAKPEKQIAPALSLGCSAFGDKRKKGESEKTALSRIANSYRAGNARAKTASRKKK